MSIAEAYPRLMEELEAVRRRWRLRRAAEGALVAAAATATAALLTAGLDNLLQPGTAGRTLLALLLWGTLFGSLVVFILQRLLEDRRDDFFASMVERRHPELGNRFINALQLGRSNGYGSPRLVEAIVHDAVEATADLELTDCIDRRALRRIALLGAAVLATLGLYATALPERFANGFARVVWPWSTVAPYTATRVAEVAPGSKRLLEQTPVTISARVTGAVPRDSALHKRTPGGAWQRVAMTPVETKPGWFQATLPALRESFDYFIRAGDGQSGLFHLEMVERPTIQRIAVEYIFPKYTGLPAQRIDDSNGDLHALAGTTARIEFTANKPLQRATLAVQRHGFAASTPGPAAEETVACTRGADDRQWLASLPITTGGTYQLRVADTEGFEEPDPVRHSITVARDLPPTVAIASPGRDLQLQPDQTLRVVVEAKDDQGLASLGLRYRLNDDPSPRDLQTWSYNEPRRGSARETAEWRLSEHRLKPGDLVQYWAIAADRNDVTGPGQSESRRFSIFVVAPETVVARLEVDLSDYAAVIEELLRLERKNRSETASGLALDGLVTQQTMIRGRTRQLSGVMRKKGMPAETVIETLEALYSGLMADAVRLLEGGRDTADAARATTLREESLPVQDAIIKQLQDLLARLERNEQAKQALRKLEKNDKPAQQEIVRTLAGLLNDLGRFVSEEKELAGKLEKMPKKPVEEFSQENAEPLKDLEAFQEQWGKWAKGKVDELTKLPTGFVDDFGLREDVNRIFEEVEKSAERPPAQKLEVAVEDLGAGLATKMKEDLELWMPDKPDFVQWVLEESLTNKPMQIPEMPLPSELEDLIGDLMQKADDFDQEADDVTSAWGDNLDQAGWDVSDGPISTFSAKGKTGNDLPNAHEVSGRSGDGRRGKSSGQMAGDTARNLEGRDTPARLNNERYEPGNLKQEAAADPKGATGGGKKAGSGRKGLQGGTPPDFVRDMQRLSEKQAGLREKAERVARELDTAGVRSRRLDDSIELMKSVEQDLRDLRYQDAARKRRVAIFELKSSAAELDKPIGLTHSRVRELPPELREQVLQSSDDTLPEGYESLVKSYFRALSEAEK